MGLSLRPETLLIDLLETQDGILAFFAWQDGISEIAIRFELRRPPNKPDDTCTGGRGSRPRLQR